MRGSRVVYEIEKRNFGCFVTIACTSVVLPAPDGAAKTNSLPPDLLLDILDLLAHLLDENFQIDSRFGCFGVRRLGTQRVRFTIKLLH